MNEGANPAFSAFLNWLEPEGAWGEALVRAAAGGHELRHRLDAGEPVENLRRLEPRELRDWSSWNASGQFRPLKSQPDLRRSWICICPSPAQLEEALQHLYPGAVADWFAARALQPPPVTHYRDFTHRQTGMYRITQMLSDQQATMVIRAGCHRDNCVKQRLWTVNGLPPDAASEKSSIPCLEPCAVLLEFARTSMRIEQEQSPGFELKPGELRSIAAALETAPAAPAGDFRSPLNPRRLKLVLEKLAPALQSSSCETPE